MIISRVIILLFASLVFFTVKPSLANKTIVSIDIYAVKGHLMPYKGTQSDLSATLYLKLNEKSFRPFLRRVYTNYQYKNETNVLPITVDDERNTLGLGIDYIINDYLKIRFIKEDVVNKNANTKYLQDSYGLIYNQFISLGVVDLNNYLEAFNIPRFSPDSFDLFARIQVLKAFYLSNTEDDSNSLYPFIQYKIKSNDNAVFGVSGSQLTAGLGYKYYNKNWSNGTLAFLTEAHSVAYQSTFYNGEWAQILVALQYTYN
jgi:hypothetical protein